MIIQIQTKKYNYERISGKIQQITIDQAPLVVGLNEDRSHVVEAIGDVEDYENINLQGRPSISSQRKLLLNQANKSC
jgi:hypothetical protein